MLSSFPRRSHTIPAEHGLGVGQLAGVLHEETGLAYKLPWLFGQHLHGALGAFVGLRRLVIFVVVVVGDNEAFFQNDIQAGFDVIGVRFLVVLVFVLVLVSAARGWRRRFEVLL